MITSKGKKIKAMCTPFDKILSSNAYLQCSINICKYPLENVDIYLPVETPTQSGYIIKHWKNVIGQNPGSSNKIERVTCLPEVKNIFIPTLIEGIGCDNQYYKFKISGNWSNENNIPNDDFLLLEIELFLNNENEDIIVCEFKDDNKLNDMICQYEGEGKIEIKEQYFEGFFEAFQINDVPSVIQAESCNTRSGDKTSSDGNYTKGKYSIIFCFILIINFILF